jgi:hypothetical protein
LIAAVCKDLDSVSKRDIKKILTKSEENPYEQTRSLMVAISESEQKGVSAHLQQKDEGVALVIDYDVDLNVKILEVLTKHADSVAAVVNASVAIGYAFKAIIKMSEKLMKNVVKDLKEIL